MQTSNREGNTQPFLIHTRMRLTNAVDRDEVLRLIEYLGGTAAEGGYAFPSDERRREALEVLVDKYGAQHFESRDDREQFDSH